MSNNKENKSNEEVEEIRTRDHDTAPIEKKIEYYSLETVGEIIELTQSKYTWLPTTMYEDYFDPETYETKTVTRLDFAYRQLNYEAGFFHYYRKRTTMLELSKPLRKLSKALKGVEDLLFEKENPNVDELFRRSPPIPRRMKRLLLEHSAHQRGPNEMPSASLDLEVKYFRDLKARVDSTLEGAVNAPTPGRGQTNPELKDFMVWLFNVYLKLFDIKEVTISRKGPAVKFVLACLRNLPFDEMEVDSDKLPVHKATDGRTILHPSVQKSTVYNAIKGAAARTIKQTSK